MKVRLAARMALALVMVVAVTGTASASFFRDRQAPTTPTNLRIAAETTYTVTLAWNASTDNSTNWWYCVQNSGSGCIKVDRTKTSVHLAKLAPGRTWVFTVYAVDGAGNRSGTSNSVTKVTPPDTAAPSPAPVITVGTLYPTRIHVSWSAAVDDTTEVFYRLLVNGSPWDVDRKYYRADVINDRAPLSTTTLQVIALDTYGNSVSSPVVSVTTPPKTENVPPSAPGNLRFLPETNAPEAWLEWDFATDNFDNGINIQYEVFVNGVRAEEATVIGWNQTVANCTTFGQPNTFAVRAVDTSGNASGFSNELVLDC